MCKTTLLVAGVSSTMGGSMQSTHARYHCYSISFQIQPQHLFDELVAGRWRREKWKHACELCKNIFFVFVLKNPFHGRVEIVCECVSARSMLHSGSNKKKAKNSGLALVHFRGELVRKSNQKIIQCFRNINVCSSSALHTIIWCIVLHHSPSTLWLPFHNFFWWIAI